MRFLLKGILAGTVLSAGCAGLGAGDAPPPAATPPDPCEIADENIRRVPADTPSIAQAVAEVGDLGRIIVAAGTYRENVEIPNNAHIVIVAEETARPELLPDDPAKPVVFVAPDARACLDRLAIRGSRSGLVVGSQATEDFAGPVTLKDVHVTDAEYGVYGLSKKMSIDASAITNNDYGLVMAGPVSILRTTIADNLLGALISGLDRLLCDPAAYVGAGTDVHVELVNISNNEQGGIAICNVASATVRNAYVHKNANTGVWLSKVQTYVIEELNVGETRKWQDEGGDGLVVVHSSGDTENSQFSANKRANVIYHGDCRGSSLENNLIIHGKVGVGFIGLDGVNPSVFLANNKFFGNEIDKDFSGQIMMASGLPDLPQL